MHKQETSPSIAEGLIVFKFVQVHISYEEQQAEAAPDDDREPFIWPGQRAFTPG